MEMASALADGWNTPGDLAAAEAGLSGFRGVRKLRPPGIGVPGQDD